MKKIAIVYFSKTGMTDLVAHQIAEGIEQAGAHVTLFEIQPKHIKEGRFSQSEIFRQLKSYQAKKFMSMRQEFLFLVLLLKVIALMLEILKL